MKPSYFFKRTSKQIANICVPPPKDFTVPIINLSSIIIYSFSFINNIRFTYNEVHKIWVYLLKL